MKKFFGTGLKVAIIVTAVWGILSFLIHYNNTQSWNPLNWPDLIYLITFLILEWIGYLLLHGRINPNAFNQQYPNTQRQPQQHQPQPIRSPQRQVPIRITLETCSFCGKETPLNSLRVFQDEQGYTIYLCEGCIG